MAGSDSETDAHTVSGYDAGASYGGKWIREMTVSNLTSLTEQDRIELDNEKCMTHTHTSNFFLVYISRCGGLSPGGSCNWKATSPHGSYISFSTA
jgi:hypothetical protein